MDEDEILRDGGYAEQGYGDKKRKTGHGPYRLGESIPIRDDLYSMIFITCFHPEYVKYLDDEKDKKEAQMEAIIKDY